MSPTDDQSKKSRGKSSATDAVALQAVKKKAVKKAAAPVKKAAKKIAASSGPAQSTKRVVVEPEISGDGSRFSAPAHAMSSYAVSNSGAAVVMAKAPVTHQDIAERAYFLWIERGGHHGSSHEDWQQAERDLGVK